jgi:branched-chain amino acid transport system permease protein
VVAAGLSGLAGIFQAMTAGAPGTTTLSVSLMVRILAVAVIARMVSLPMAAAASAVIGILDQGVLWSSGTLVALDGVLLVIVGGVLALQRVRISRAELEQASEFRAARQVRPTPRELAGHPSVKRWYRTGRVALVVVLLGAPWALTPAQSNLASLVALKAMVGLSLLLLTGWAGQISLGQFAFAAIGGYVVAAWGAPFPIAILAGALAAAGASTLVGLPAVRMRGLHLAITTLAFALSVSALLLNPRYLGGALPASIERPALIGMDLDDDRVFYYLTLAFLAAVVAGVLGLRRSRTARALLATRDNEAAAQSFGINLVRLRLSASALSGFVAGLAGGLFAYHQHGVQAQAFAPEESVLIFTIAVLGGLGSITSILTGFAVYAVLLLVGAGTLAQLVFVGGGGLALLMFSPGGLGELVFATRDAILRRLAARENIVVPSLVADIADTDEPRAPIAPNLRSRGGTVFVPPRYRLDDQWAISQEEPV